MKEGRSTGTSISVFFFAGSKNELEIGNFSYIRNFDKLGVGELRGI
jgi:hypothetical protein